MTRHLKGKDFRKIMVLEEQVFSILANVVVGDSPNTNYLTSSKFIKQGSLSKFHHSIDFELCRCKESGEFFPIGEYTNFGKKANPINGNTDQYERIAVILQLSENAIVKMTVRQLEALGYRVVLICENMWNSMALSSDREKINYITDLLSISDEKRKEASNGDH